MQSRIQLLQQLELSESQPPPTVGFDLSYSVFTARGRLTSQLCSLGRQTMKKNASIQYFFQCEPALQFRRFDRRKFYG